MKIIIKFINKDDICNFNLTSNVDFFINLHAHLGSVLVVNGEQNESYISEIQHVRRRETIAMTPANSLAALNVLIEKSSFDNKKNNVETNKTLVWKHKGKYKYRSIETDRETHRETEGHRERQGHIDVVFFLVSSF